MRIPKKLATCVDKLYDVKSQIKEKKVQLAALKLSKELVKLEADVKQLETHIIETIANEKDMSGVIGATAKAVVKSKVVPSVQDWGAIYRYILKHKDFSLLQKRLSSTAFRERWDAGEDLPGVQKMFVKTLSLTKR